MKEELNKLRSENITISKSIMIARIISFGGMSFSIVLLILFLLGVLK
jgi:hypothetical protein